MPPGSRFLVKAALAHLLLGATIGVLLSLPDRGLALGLRPALHADVMLVGWMLQLVAGIASWIFPRDADAPVDQRPLIAGAVLLNASVVAALAGSLEDLPRIVAIARVGELAGLGLVFATLVPRIRGARFEAQAVTAPRPPSAPDRG